MAQHFKKAPIPNAVRRAVAWKYGYLPGEGGPIKCHFCDFIGAVGWTLTQKGKVHSWVTFHALELDHLIPEYLGGLTTVENLVLSCRYCNRSRGHAHPTPGQRGYLPRPLPRHLVTLSRTHAL